MKICIESSSADVFRVWQEVKDAVQALQGTVSKIEAREVLVAAIALTMSPLADTLIADYFAAKIRAALANMNPGTEAHANVKSALAHVEE